MSSPFNHQYLLLGDAFYQRIAPTPVEQPGLIRFNVQLADELGLSFVDKSDDDIASIFAGNVLPEGAKPLAMVYTGHQFGHFNSQLGDGRAILLGEVDDRQGHSMGIQLKGSGPTMFSRSGDGRAALGPVLREYLVSEAMYQLGVPTTRALAAVTTGEAVVRQGMIPGGVITRVARSFVRVGTFQYFASRGEVESVRKLANHVIKHNYPELEAKLKSDEQAGTALLRAVVERQARLVAQWMGLGFIHGVMNTDNMSVSGETIDYGPCAFMDAYRHDQVFSSIDHYGRYAYGNQPAMALWNLTRFAECLVPLIHEDANTGAKMAEEILEGFAALYERQWLDVMAEKIGLFVTERATREDDIALTGDLLALMEDNQVDFTLGFRYLSRLDGGLPEDDTAFTGLFHHSEKIKCWLTRWRERLGREVLDDAQRCQRMLAVNPIYIPRNHQIEKAIRAAEDQDDFSVFHRLHEVLQSPYTEQAGNEIYGLPPEPEERVLKTFCGT